MVKAADCDETFPQGGELKTEYIKKNKEVTYTSSTVDKPAVSKTVKIEKTIEKPMHPNLVDGQILGLMKKILPYFMLITGLPALW
ncbi:hypothetical protein AQ505_06000 [Pedobacter sp. PACM 27299]|nr:hypothetical protein AQ505_06000 [Pedobacter sp. PACM 27299]